ncbi:sulfotransferase, partial [Abyssibacter sp.]|uniref:sulfotransferase n=1 Tax=Abyssibacter sp. TaxID=2320200 RepID=UPI003514B5B3
MQAAFRRSLRVHAKMLRSALAPDPAAPRSPARLARLAALMPPYLAVQTMHWAGFALDELLYAGYRGVRVDQPLFVLGIPRSGTTFVHRTLAADPAFTTLSTWEAVLAPSITERRVWLALAQVDDRLGRPASRLLNRFVRRLAGDFDDIHGVDLTAAEEDYLALIPAAGCFLLALGLPASQDLWGLATFDETLDDADRSILLDFYHALLQKHLYVHGPDRRILSKNAAFASWAPALAARYPEARFLVCV